MTETLDGRTQRLLNAVVANATPAQHVQASYQARVVVNPPVDVEADAQTWRDALVSTAKYLGRPLTAAETKEALSS